MSIPDRWPREPDDLIDLHSRDPYEVESADHYRCPHCGLIATAILHIARDPGGRECIDVECRDCHASLREQRDIATRCACDRCRHEYAEHDRTDWCHSCGVAEELDETRAIGRSARAVNDEIIDLIREITLAQAVRP